MTKKKLPQPKTRKDDSTGTYVFDKQLGKVVKVSDKVPSVSSKGKGADFSDAAPSNPACASCPSGGACGMGGGFDGDF
ncbi:MAG TPA: hypothetical protein DEB40_07660 [Elusimicrobia bacterium]|nr:hypothetical protein [Elusimicrobiota bacterium]HBT61604.1 hypothetical protein [Elusimicrobiota bacterium]